jgi:membrane-bound ClpP family serine protease
VRGKKGQLIAGLVLLTVGALFILDRLIILEIYISWPVILVAVGVALFLIDRQSLASWIVGGIGIILFIVNFAIAFFPEVEAWSDLIWPTILVIIGVLLLYRYYQNPSPKLPAQPPPPQQEEQGAKPEDPPKNAGS